MVVGFFCATGRLKRRYPVRNMLVLFQIFEVVTKPFFCVRFTFVFQLNYFVMR
jgi:hypothetical protein